MALRRGAERVASTRDLATRLPQDGGPEEVRWLAGSLNAMLERLQHVIVLAVRWSLRFGLSYRDVEELLAERGV